jgi:hypothetical protein
VPRTLPIPRTVSRATACAHLGVSAVTFWRHWRDVFTDGRGAGERGPGRHARYVLEDELRAAVEAGGGVGSRAKAAVYDLRKLMNRI